MKIGGRIAAAIEVLTEVETRHRPVSESLKDWGVAHRFAGSGDRAVIGNIVYDALRWRASSAWVAGDEAPRGVVLAMLARRWKLNLANALREDPHAPAPPTEDEAARIATADLDGAPAHVQADVPEWVAPHLARVFGEAWMDEGRALALRPPLDMRANRLRSSRDKVVDALHQFRAEPTPHSPDGIRIAPTAGAERHPNVQVEPSFQKGWFEVQDEGSQIAAFAVAARPGEQILDLCAGAGGKTLALASVMGGKGRVVATDDDRARLAPIFERTKRAGAHNVEVLPARSNLDGLTGKMDAVLIDAPCTGTGIWRRRPDSKWKLTERALGNRLREQSELLASAARYVKPGGRLVYATCSLLPEENAGQVTAFVSANSGFRPLSGAEVLAGAGLSAPSVDVGNGVVLSPARTGTDGFFVAVLRRT
ncbi:MAG TPA: RsmB/NOP family class I SAM-dependent RNA methyltransferase [Bauldia sp.]|nr:RsmB/NOP family class I SAM-dependent RNA methyltransferase [Bauldia sp.]